MSKLNPGRSDFSTPILTTGLVVNCVNVLNIDVVFNLTPQDMSNMSSALTEKITYTVIDHITLEESPPILATAYRTRLKGITVPNDGKNCAVKRKIINTATTQMRSVIMLTGGIFRFKIHGIDDYNRVLVEIINPVNGRNINNDILEKYGSAIKPYNPPRNISPREETSK